MYGWGNTVNGELGLGGIEEEHILVPRALNFTLAKQVSRVGCGYSHTVMVLEDGSVYTCGNNDASQLGHNKSWKRPELVDALQPHVIRQVACGANHTLVVNEWGQVFSWGGHQDGQLGHEPGEVNWNAVPRMVKTLGTKQVLQIACGASHSLALTNTGDLYVWGSNRHGQLGLGLGISTQTKPRQLASLQGIPLAQIACGAEHSIVLSVSGAIFGWGKNSFGQLGLNDDRQREHPTLLRALRMQRIKYVACGEDHTVALTHDGGVFTFGAGMYGQLGHNTSSNEITPRKVSELMGTVVTQVACGRRHTLAYAPSRGRIYSFGVGGRGQLGNSSAKNSLTPVVVQGPWVAPLAAHYKAANSSENDQCVVERLFSGGDHCFVHISTLADGKPISLDDFRKFYPEEQVLCLTLDKAEECITVQEGESVSQELMSYIESAFTSMACINASFLKANDEHYGCSRYKHGVDMRVVRQFFDILSKVANSVIMDLITHSFEKELIPSLIMNVPDVEALRLYLVLPEYHLFKDPDSYSTVSGPFGHSLLHLTPEASKILDIWWGRLQQPYFHNIVQVYKAVVAHILLLPESKSEMEKRTRDKGLEVSMRILDKLNMVNNENKYIVPYDTFYVPEITQRVDVRFDYVHWLQFGKMPGLHYNVVMGGRLFFCNYPFAFDARAKTLLLQTDADLQMQSAVDEAVRRNYTSLFLPINPTNPFLLLYVTRQNIVEETIQQLHKYSNAEFKKPLKVVFCGEDAVDAGGVRKEFFLLLLKEILDPKYGMFKEYDAGSVWFNEQSFEDDEMFHLIGVLCGLAIYNGNIIALPFPLAIYKKLLKEPTKLDDLKDLSASLMKGLQDLLNYPGDDLADVFMLQFEITRDIFGEMVTNDLKPGGSRITVTKENRQEYVDLYVDYILNKSVERQFHEFYNGFHKVCGGRVLELFHAQELMEMLIGNENYNWKELEENTEYKPDFSKDHPTICLFWKVFHSLELEDKKKFLSFLTGSDRIPILGMKSVKLYVQPTSGGEQYLPVAHTCFNLLDLPRYTTEEVLRNKLLQAISHTQGFALA